MSIRKEKIAFFENTLRDFASKAGREHLPWRIQDISPYAVWVSEIMLQQTQVSRVIEYYTRFLERFPTVEQLAQASWEDFLPYYQGLGYYARGRNMLLCARVIVEQYAGQFPRDKKLLEALPGVGPYTAAAIMSFGYGDEHLAWDTNLKRVIGRFFFGDKRAVRDEMFWENALRTPRKILNGALMDFGSALCVARPKCEACPLSGRCIYYRERGKQEAASATQKTETRDLAGRKIDWKKAQVCVFLHENHKRYFSADAKTFRPFVLSSGYNTRAGIKAYFQKQHALALSVRPPHQKVLLAGRPTLLVNAQILLGTPPFSVFSKADKEQYTEDIV